MSINPRLNLTTINNTQTYQHNALNQRVAKLINGQVVEKYLWRDLTTLLAIYDKDDNLVQRFEYASNRMPVAMTQNGQKYYLHYDQVGSLRAVSDTNHNIIKEITYDTYGNILTDTNSDLKVPFGFAGGLYDADTKLTRFGYRDYDAYTGKWTAKDPIGFDGGDSNLYGYVFGDPINLFDEDGLSPKFGGRKGAFGSIGGGNIGTYPPFFSSTGSSSLGDSIGNAIDDICEKTNNICEELNNNVKRAKKNLGGLGRCELGMTRYELGIRKKLWLDLAIARAQRDVVCWGGGDEGHQEAHAAAWKNVGTCQGLLW